MGMREETGPQPNALVPPGSSAPQQEGHPKSSNTMAMGQRLVGRDHLWEGESTSGGLHRINGGMSLLVNESSFRVCASQK